ncbi:reverse transcriptase domain-containing protein [Tanacetum coccineum]|uniref:Reverse transcriptase domain-containing protein n=1 Tax=Tanacetum coccineum TaxID=301880 RepID=A0ABQ5DXF9_9ASTR
MADQRTMEELLRAPTEGYAEAIIVPPILAEHFELKHSLINLIASVVTSAMTAMFKQYQVTTTPTSVKAVEESCVTCGGVYSYRQCTAPMATLFRDIKTIFKRYVSRAAALNFNQGNTDTSSKYRSTTSPSGISEDVFVKVGKFHFLANFVVVDYVVDPRVPLFLGRPFLRMAHALIDVYGEELTLRVNDEAITFKVGQTLRYSYNDVVSINRIDVIDVACEEYAQEIMLLLVLGSRIVPRWKSISLSSYPFYFYPLSLL